MTPMEYVKFKKAFMGMDLPEETRGLILERSAQLRERGHSPSSALKRATMEKRVVVTIPPYDPWGE